MGRVTRRKKGIGPSCPDCGHTESSTITRGWSTPDDLPLRHRKCVGCELSFVTVETIVPLDETSFYRLDYRGRIYRREYYRRHKAKSNVRFAGQPSDELTVTVKVKPTRQIKGSECIRGHELTKDNIYIWPNGNKTCRLCRSIRNHDYYLRRRETWNDRRKKVA